MPSSAPDITGVKRQSGKLGQNEKLGQSCARAVDVSSDELCGPTLGCMIDSRIAFLYYADGSNYRLSQ